MGKKRKRVVKKVDIRIRMLERGYLTQEALAKEIGVTRTAINMVMTGRERIPRLQEAIASRLGFDVKDMFPSYAPKPERQKVEA